MAAGSITKNLYYDTPYLREAEVEVRRVLHLKEFQPPRTGIIFDRSMFYPEGGGQPGDRGSFNEIHIIDTQKVSSLKSLSEELPRDEVVHLCALNTTISVGDKGSLVLDWNHRLDYMQQHSGQHIISAAFYKIGRYPTISVHQGSEYTTIEFEAGDIPDGDITAAGELANRAIQEDLPVVSRLAEDDEVKSASLRRSLKADSNIRLVEIGGFNSDGSDGFSHPFDLVGCGGVHLGRCGEVRLIRHIKTERIRGRVRLYWKIGDRALEDYRTKHWAIDEAGSLLSRPPEDIPARIAQMKDEIVNLKRRVREQEREKIYATIDNYRQQNPDTLLSLHFEGVDMNLLKDSIRRIQKTGTVPAILSSWSEMDPDKIFWIMLDQNSIISDFSTVRRDILISYGARGGGDAPLWQGSLPVTGNDSSPSPDHGEHNTLREQNTPVRKTAEEIALKFRNSISSLLAGQ